MDAWYSINLGDAMLVRLERIEELFRSEYDSAGKPDDMAMFTRHESSGDLHCELVAYLSPASRRVASVIDAESCDKPSPEGLSLLVGCQGAWRKLFNNT